MNYIIVDFEWNQPVSEAVTILKPIRFDSEIIEIGAVKLNENFEKIGEFQSYVRPLYYPVLHGKVASLTKIRAQKLASAPYFPEAYRAFSAWCGEDCCFCTWGPDDIPALFDNLIMHRMFVPGLVYWCDLQKIFSVEIMRSGKNWALSEAVDTLGIPKARSHDALNDVLNTYAICTRVDLQSYFDYYESTYIDYGIDCLGGLISGRQYSNLEEAQQDKDMVTMYCPYCGEKVMLGDWLSQSKRVFVSYGRCSEGDEFLARYKKVSTGTGPRVTRRVYTMSDLLWDYYQDILERNSIPSEMSV